ncbi:MAG: SOS response-associated peptidase family protein, partial [Bdellovibrionales bacterium]|nr:SOS response-associated peptidase family protein [Bdellovibrionales bacterium]
LKELFSFSIITVVACAELKKIHHRMPLILPDSQLQAWLNPTTELSKIRSICQDATITDLSYHPVSKAVNSPKNNTAVNIAPENLESNLFARQES